MRLRTLCFEIPVLSPSYPVLASPPLYVACMLRSFFCFWSYWWRFLTRAFRFSLLRFGVRPRFERILRVAARGPSTADSARDKISSLFAN